MIALLLLANMSESRERQTLDKTLRVGLHPGAYTCPTAWVQHRNLELAQSATTT